MTKEQQLHVDSALFERTMALRLRTVNNKLLAATDHACAWEI